jgi:hypothetical protein
MLAINAKIAKSIEILFFFALHSYNIKPIQVENIIKLRKGGKSSISKAENLMAKIHEIIQ